MPRTLGAWARGWGGFHIREGVSERGVGVKNRSFVRLCGRDSQLNPSAALGSQLAVWGAPSSGMRGEEGCISSSSRASQHRLRNGAVGSRLHFCARADQNQQEVFKWPHDSFLREPRAEKYLLGRYNSVPEAEEMQHTGEGLKNPPLWRSHPLVASFRAVPSPLWGGGRCGGNGVSLGFLGLWEGASLLSWALHGVCGRGGVFFHGLGGSGGAHAFRLPSSSRGRPEYARLQGLWRQNVVLAQDALASKGLNRPVL